MCPFGTGTELRRYCLGFSSIVIGCWSTQLQHVCILGMGIDSSDSVDFDRLLSFFRSEKTHGAPT